ncbi:hypothetical protein LCGC14_1383890 [marine sediment metagenome]|uniref:Uncharacterized protein n=1 Tax=marine sediment metagenome TaxID=412755 RepID=A0A0F9K1Y0_9ZZZZ
MIDKIYEFVCDTCQAGCYHSYQFKEQAILDAKAVGIIITKSGKVYCDEECYKKRKNKKIPGK